MLQCVTGEIHKLCYVTACYRQVDRKICYDYVTTMLQVCHDYVVVAECCSPGFHASMLRTYVATCSSPPPGPPHIKGSPLDDSTTQVAPRRRPTLGRDPRSAGLPLTTEAPPGAPQPLWSTLALLGIFLLCSPSNTNDSSSQLTTCHAW